MEIFDNLLLGLSVASSWKSLLWCFYGTIIGTLVGVLPGIGPITALSLLLPVAYHIDTVSAMIFLASVYYGSQYGGSTASILLNLPGTPGNAVTCLDGYPMSRQGRGGIALSVSAISSMIGGLIGILLIIFLSPALANLAFQFGPAEYFSVMLIGLVAVCVMGSNKDALRNLTMVVLGMLLGFVGMDLNTSAPRFMFGFPQLADGISMILVAMGLIGLPEIIRRAVTWNPKFKVISPGRLMPSKKDFKEFLPASVRGSAVGGIFGPLPGTGPAIAGFMSYLLEKTISRKPKKFGKGEIRGVAGPEAANNSGAQTEFIPTMLLGIPGDTAMPLIMAALVMHGITPGPALITAHPDLYWGLLASFLIGNIMLIILNLPLVGIWVKLLRIPYGYLYPALLLCIVFGAYSVNNNPFDILLVAVFGLLGYTLNLLKFETTPVLLGLILGPLMEEYLRRALSITGGDFSIFVTRPISLTFITLSVLMLICKFISIKKRPI